MEFERQCLPIGYTQDLGLQMGFRCSRWSGLTIELTGATEAARFGGGSDRKR